MAVFVLDEEIVFPDPELAEDTGLLAVGGDLSHERLLLAYAMGIFPWPHRGYPLLWFSPDPRLLLQPQLLHVPRSLRKLLRRDTFRVTFDSAFGRVMEGCATVERKDGPGTWITDRMLRAYQGLHRLGFAHSVEVWLDDELAGGLYGLSLGGAFFGESMFTRRSNASKVALVALARQLAAWEYSFIDCQVPVEHLMRYGAEEIPRSDFLAMLEDALEAPTRVGPWALDVDVDR